MNNEMAVTLDERVETACKEMRESEEPSTITNVCLVWGLESVMSLRQQFLM